jgi:hypothetical protein
MVSLTSNGRATTERKLFSRETAFSIDIQSDKSVLWALLTTAGDYPRWNSTVLSIQGVIAANETIVLKSTLDPKRNFKLKVKTFQPDKQLIWGDAMGTRIFTIQEIGNNLTRFTMSEKIGGPLFPLFAKMIPPFNESFEQFARDLKKEAETISKSK